MFNMYNAYVAFSIALIELNTKVDLGNYQSLEISNFKLEGQLFNFDPEFKPSRDISILFPKSFSYPHSS